MTTPDPRTERSHIERVDEWGRFRCRVCGAKGSGTIWPQGHRHAKPDGVPDPIDPIWTGVPETKIDPSNGRPSERAPWFGGSGEGAFLLTLALMVIAFIVAFIFGWAAPG